MPMKVGLEFGTVVGLDDQDAEREPAQHFIDESNRRPLVAGIEHLQHANARAVVDRGELVQPFPSPRDPLKELDIDLQTMPGLRLLVALPPFAMRPMLPIGRQRFMPWRTWTRWTDEIANER